MLDKFLSRFFKMEVNYDYKLQDGKVIKVGKQKIEKVLPLGFSGRVGKVVIILNGKRIVCPIYQEGKGETTFELFGETIYFKELEPIVEIAGA